MSTHVPAGHSVIVQEAGWTRRFTSMGRRLEEAVELYRQLGFEVLLKPARSFAGAQDDTADAQDDIAGDQNDRAGAESCRHCFVTAYARAIYTRPSKKE